MQHANPDWLVQAEENMMIGPNLSKVIWTWFESMNLNLNHSFVMQNSVGEKPPLYRHGNWKNIDWRSQMWLPNKAYEFTKRYLPVPPANSGKISIKQTNFQLSATDM